VIALAMIKRDRVANPVEGLIAIEEVVDHDRFFLQDPGM